MEKKALFGLLAVISFVAIGFTKTDSSSWIWLMILGIVFGIGWWMSK